LRTALPIALGTDAPTSAEAEGAARGRCHRPGRRPRHTSAAERWGSLFEPRPVPLMASTTDVLFTDACRGAL